MGTAFLNFTEEQAKVVNLTDAEKQKLAQDYFNRIFANSIQEDKPTAYFVGAPIAAGKGSIVGALRHLYHKLNKRHLPYIDRDVLREMHPRLDKVKKMLGSNWVRGTDDCAKVREMVIDMAIEAGYSFVGEYTFSSKPVIEAMKNAKAKGFKVEAHIIATALIQSKMRQFERYFAEYEIYPKNARYETVQNQQSVYSSQPEIINQVAKEGCADLMAFYDKDMQPQILLEGEELKNSSPYESFSEIQRHDLSTTSITRLYNQYNALKKKIQKFPDYEVGKTMRITANREKSKKYRGITATKKISEYELHRRPRVVVRQSLKDSQPVQEFNDLGIYLMEQINFYGRKMNPIRTLLARQPKRRSREQIAKTMAKKVYDIKKGI